MLQLKHKVILGSGSPRRKELLSALISDFTVQTSDEEEIFPKDLHSSEVAGYLAKQKWENIQKNLSGDDILITSDTVVVVDEHILAKPNDRQESIEMIRLLSGRTHHVYTAVCIGNNKHQVLETSLSAITFKKLQTSEIEYYVDTFKPFDKAGSYGIQEWIGMIGITNINGSYFSVMGFPVDVVYRLLQEAWT